MMGSRRVREPAELVIWSATALLGIMIGIGTAFMLWVPLHRTADPAVLDGAVVALALGMSLVAVAFESLAARLFVWVASATLVIAFFAGASAFAAIAG